jgi:hypothetical protein
MPILKEFSKGGKFYERGGSLKTAQASKEFMKTYMKTGKPPEWAQFTKDVESAKTSAQAPKPKQSSVRTQTPPGQTSPAAPKPPSASTPPPPSTPSRNVPSTSVKPPAPKGSGLRSGLGRVLGPAANVASAAMDYKERRAAGQSRPRAAGGAASSLAGFAAGAKFGAMVPGPPIVKGVAALGGGMLGAQKAQQVYDYAADKSRPARQAVSKATGFDKFQQKNVLIKPGSGLSGIRRAQQTVDTRGGRQVAAQSGTYGARQGSAITGIGPRTSFNQKAATVTSQGRTANLASTQLVRDPKSGQQRVGDLAYKGGKAVYLARPSVASRDTSLAARLGRALNIGRYSKGSKQQAAKQEYRTALKNTQTYQKQLGITSKQATAQKLPGR